MRGSALIVAVLLIFAVLARTIWLNSATVVYAYEIRQLREQKANLQNHNALCSAEVAKRRTERALNASAIAWGLEDLVLAESQSVAVVRVRAAITSQKSRPDRRQVRRRAIERIRRRMPHTLRISRLIADRR